MRRTKEDAAETGRQILHAAESLFLENGYDNVSLEDIAVAAGVTRGAVHWHYKNKQGLLVGLRRQATVPFQQLADGFGECTGGASFTLLNEVISELFERLESDPRQQGLIRWMLRLDIALAENSPEPCQIFRNEMHQIFTKIFQAVERDVGLPAPWTPSTAAAALRSTIDGLLVNWAIGTGVVRLSPDGQIFVKMILALWKK